MKAIPSMGRPSPSPTPTSTSSVFAEDDGKALLLEIDLYKHPGRGLGIAVTGGPKHIITNGIKVCGVSITVSRQLLTICILF